MRIYGAGLAGLLAAHMLRRFSPVVLETQPSLPNNHEALLRFRTDNVSRATGIPFRKVRVEKAISYSGQIVTQSNLHLNNLYSRKVTGEIRTRSILKLEPADRYIAPPDFISQLARSCNITYEVAKNEMRMIADSPEPIISTIPMPYLMDMFNWESKPSFNAQSITTIYADFYMPIVDVYQTLYYPGAEPWYRASITGNHIMAEMVTDLSVTDPSKLDWSREIQNILKDFGIFSATVHNVGVKTQKLGKITPVPDRERKSFILAMTDLHNIYSVGRFATWRQILLDDVVNDIGIVEKFVIERDSYTRHIL
jgi:hypothetical protein